MKVGDLVEECIPLMAGDVTPRVGLLLSVDVSPTDTGQPIGRFATVLFGNKEEWVSYNDIRKVESHGR